MEAAQTGDQHQGAIEEPGIGLLLGNIYAFNGLPFFSPGGRQWIRAQTGHDVNLLQYTPPRRIRTLYPNAVLTRIELPNMQVLYRYMNLYTASAIFDIFPFIDPSLFEQTIETAYRGRNSAYGAPASAQACVFAFMSAASLLLDELNDERLSKIDVYAAQAYQLLPAFFGDPAGVDGLQAVLMLVWSYSDKTSQMNGADSS